MTIRLPATMQVFERGWLSSNNILFTGRDTALVDSGYVTHAPQTLALVRHALGARRLDRLLNTHLHSDHCGGNAALQQEYGCQTAIPALEAANVAHWNEEALSYRATGQQCPRFSYDALLAPGDTLTLGDLRWQVLGAPGHDPHALLLFCPQEGILIAGDALWQNGFGVVFPELAGEPGFDEVRATLDLIATLDARLVVPGHGALFTDVEDALARAYARLDYLAADPRRNAENAIKVLLKFLLLERGGMALAEVPGLFASIPVVGSAMRMMGVVTSTDARAQAERVGGEPAYPTAHGVDRSTADASNERPHTDMTIPARRVGGSAAYASNQHPHTDTVIPARRVGGSAAYASNQHPHTDTVIPARRVGGSTAYASNEGPHPAASNDVHDHASTSAAYTTLADWAIAALVRAGAARIDGANLMNA